MYILFLRLSDALMHYLEDLTLIKRYIMKVIDIDMWSLEFPAENLGHCC